MTSIRSIPNTANVQARRPRWALRRWVRWGVVALIYADAWYWSDSWRVHCSFLGMLARPCGGLTCVLFYRPHAYVVEEAGATRLVDGSSDEGERVRSAPRPGESVRAVVSCWLHTTTMGLLAPAVRTVEHHASVVPVEGVELSPEEMARLRAQVVGCFGPGGPWAGRYEAEEIALLAAGDGTTRRVQWGWLLHDLVLGSLGLGTIAVWPWAREWEQRERKRLRDAALAAGGTCPGCAYSRKGLPPGAPCPECGAVPPGEPTVAL